MAGLAELRKRISSVKNTQKITQAMKMVSAAKLKRAQDRVTNLRPYSQGLLTAIADIAVSHRVHHPLLSEVLDPQKVLLVVVTSDRGLCGSFNSSVNKFAYQFYQENKKKYKVMDLLFIGKRGSDFFRNRKITGVETILNMAKEVSFATASSMAERVKHAFSEGEYDEVKLIYNEFKSAISQEVISETLLPVDVTHSEINNEETSFAKDIIFEPKPDFMIEALLEKHFSIQVFRCLSESVAAEHGARMTAMDNSTRNAGEMINKMSLTYNKLRQEAITTELTEIISGAESV